MHKVKDVEVKVKEAEKIISPPKFKIKFKTTEKNTKEDEKLLDSPEGKQKIKEAENKAKSIAETANYSASAFKGKEIKANEDIRYFIDDNPATKAEVEQFDPQRIRLMHVNKPELNGVKLFDIRIITKKEPNPKT